MGFDKDLPLGKSTQYSFEYDPKLLYPISRQLGRDQLGSVCDFYGADRWLAYELSWLDLQGLPQVVLAQFDFDAHSPNIIESKSFKLYLNSLNQTRFENQEAVLDILHQDLAKVSGAGVAIEFFDQSYQRQSVYNNYELLEQTPVACEVYQPDASLLKINTQVFEKQAYRTSIFRSLCPVTSQPDWASIYIDCLGAKLDPQSLLQYLVSYRNHQGFHEQCVEQIFVDLQKLGKFENLSVSARFLRRGGLDINPIRTTEKTFSIPSWFDFRQ